MMIPSVAVLALVVVVPSLVAGEMEELVGYLPSTQVTDHAAIDLDQMILEEKLNQGKFNKAMQVYEHGGHSMSYAELLLTNPSGYHIFHKGDRVVGLSPGDDEVVGHLMDVVDFNNQEGQDIGIRVQYRTNNDQSTYVNCQVGGLATFGGANKAGCFADVGSVSIYHNGEWFPFNYKYDIEADNKNGRTLQKLSTEAEEEMRSCQVVCPYYNDYQLFRKYYGRFDYGDVWFRSALGQSPTGFGRGDNDFGLFQFGTSVAQAAQKGTVGMSVWMYVVKELEDALYQCFECEKGSRECREGPVDPLDEAVAFYAGSLKRESAKAKGKMLYDLADWASQTMKTNGEQSNEQHGTSYVNTEIIRLFNNMQESLNNGACEDAGRMKNTIVNLMKIPLIQGVIISAYKRDHPISVLPEVQEADMADGATFVASVLPYLNACSADDADFIHRKLKVGSDTDAVRYTEIKQVLERHYPCLGITCAHVGGIWTFSGYAPGGAPCEDGMGLEVADIPVVMSAEEELKESNDSRVRLLIFFSLFGAGGAVLIFLYVAKYVRKLKAKRQQQQVPTFGNITPVSEIA